jgi:tryptophan 2,3-dioxygenase
VLEYKLGIRTTVPQFPAGGDDRTISRRSTRRASATMRQLAKEFDIPKSAYERAAGAPYMPSEVVEDAWLAVYRDTTKYWSLYQLAEKLIDLDDAFLTWRHKHVLTVERIIGRKRGTGGTEGVGYLQQTLTRRAFPEIWSLRTKL